jgi:hypothetical protein
MTDREIAHCTSKHNPMPDFAGAAGRLTALAEIAALLGDDKTADKAEAAAGKWQEEIAAQEAYEAMIAKAFPPEEKALKSFLLKHKGTRYAKAVKDNLEPAGK